jgi:hypothetical protein
LKWLLQQRIGRSHPPGNEVNMMVRKLQRVLGISGGANGGGSVPGVSAGVGAGAKLNPLGGLGVGASTGLGLG